MLRASEIARPPSLRGMGAEEFFPLQATSANCASAASTGPSGELCDEVGGYKRTMRAQQAQKQL
jgi:hypothetical protein